MHEAITDTGPVLHLHEIDWLEALRVFDRLVMPDLVAEELRRQLENHQATVVGSVGILVRAYTTGYLNRHELENATDALFTTSTLHLSRAFRSYIQHLIASLP